MTTEKKYEEIYVRVIDEYMDYFMPVMAEKLEDEKFKLPIDATDSVDQWEFKPGEIVGIKMTQLVGGLRPVACAMNTLSLEPKEFEEIHKLVINPQFISNFIKSNIEEDWMSDFYKVCSVFLDEKKTSNIILNFSELQYDILSELCFNSLLFLGYEDEAYKNDIPKIIESVGIRASKFCT